MAGFHYSMQSILNIKLKMETQAKQEFSAARAVLDVEEETLSRFIGRKREYEAEAVKLLEGGTENEKKSLCIQTIRETKMAISCMEERIEAQKFRVATAEKSLDQARERLTEVMKERKTHETLKEKAYQEFLADWKRQESREVDELTSYTYGRRTVEGQKTVQMSGEAQ